ncbi:MAG: L-rhamnose/proton symporter RhaT [Planctomycetota bacterium]
MPIITANPLLGIALHAVGAFFAATCYTPQKHVKRWSWQTYWMTQAAFCWFLLPILGALLTIPHLGTVLSEAPPEAMRNAFLLGALYGVGGTAFGLAIKHIGFSLTYAIAVGLSGVVGTLVPPLLKGTLGAILAQTGGGWVLLGVGVGTVGIAVCGVAGRSKEVDVQGQEASKGFSLRKGLPVALLAGVLSAVYGLALDAGKPIAEVAFQHGADIWKGNVVYIFSNSGAFLTTLVYCLYLHAKHKTIGELVKLPAGEERASLPVNFSMAVLTGLFWYGQFFFYNLGNVRMGHFEFTSWAIHMTMLVLFSSVVGVVLKEWLGCRPRTRWTLILALAILVGAILLLAYGNHIGQMAAESS